MSGINGRNFYSVFTEIYNVTDIRDHGLICYSKDRNHLRVKRDAPIPEGFKRLTLNEIIDRTQEKEIASKDVKFIENTLRYMAIQKNSKCYSSCTGKIREFFSRIQNYFSYGVFETSAERATNFANLLQTRLPEHEEKSKTAEAAPIFPILWDSATIKGERLTHYNQTHTHPDQIDPQRCHVVSKTFFTYFEAVSQEMSKERAPHVEHYSGDLGWGCAWRSTINMLESAKNWIKERGISPLLELNRQIDMGDIANWNTFGKNAWMEPIDGAELFFRFVQTHYSQEDQERIFKLLHVQGHLFSKYDKNITLANILSRQINRGYKGKEGGVNNNENEVLPLNNLRSYFWGKDWKTKHKQIVAFLKDKKVKTEADFKKTFGEDAQSVKDIDQLLTPENLREGFSFEKHCAVAMALVRFYPNCHNNVGVKVDQCPKINEGTHSLPLMIDDGTTARNISGYHINQNNEITHVFLADPHVGWGGMSDNPWLAGTWRPFKSVLEKTDQLMMFSLVPTIN